MRFKTLSIGLFTLALTASVASAEELASAADLAPPGGVMAAAPEAPPPALEKGSYVPVNIAFLPRVELNAGYPRPTNTLSLGIIGGSAATTRGLAVSGVAQLNSEDVRGAQIAGVFNHAGRDVTGLQVAGVASTAGGVTRGAQISGVLNVATDVRGLQLAGVVNVAGKVKGVQLGLVNVADEVDGVSLGLVNIVRRNGLRTVGVWTSDSSPANVGVRLGTERFYSILSAGARPVEGEEAQYSAGFGFGTRVRTSDDVSIGLELQSFAIAQDWEDTGDQLQKLGVVASWTPAARVTVFGGPALNVLYSADGHALSDVGAIGSFDRIELDGAAAVELGLGFMAGVQVR